MKITSKTKQFFSSLAVAMLVVLNYSCDTAVETCEDVPELCEEEVRVCEYDETEYYTLNGEKYYCDVNCDEAETSVVNSCTIASVKNELEIKQLLSEIRNELRLNE